jgi:hypothetical protein
VSFDFGVKNTSRLQTPAQWQDVFQAQRFCLAFPISWNDFTPSATETAYRPHSNISPNYSHISMIIPRAANALRISSLRSLPMHRQTIRCLSTTAPRRIAMADGGRAADDIDLAFDYPSEMQETYTTPAGVHQARVDKEMGYPDQRVLYVPAHPSSHSPTLGVFPCSYPLGVGTRRETLADARNSGTPLSAASAPLASTAPS